MKKCYNSTIMVVDFAKASPGIYIPEIRGDLLIAHGDRRIGNVDPRFSVAEGDWMQNRERFFGHIGLTATDVAVIGIETQRGALDEFVDLGDEEPPREAIVTDGLITARPGMGLMLNPADCMPLALYHPDERVLALVHLGWMGIDLGLHDAMLEHTTSVYGVDPEKTIAYLGPSIGPDSYVRSKDSVREGQLDDPRWKGHITQDQEGRLHVDLPGVVKSNLAEGFGITTIHDSGVDVAADPHHFSYTRHKATGEPNGRNAFVVAMRS
jgi:copper oxidase (laccase) domain-containing protein